MWLLWTERLCSPQIPMLMPQLQYDVFGDEAFRE